MLYEVFLKP